MDKVYRDGTGETDGTDGTDRMGRRGWPRLLPRHRGTLSRMDWTGWDGGKVLIEKVIE